MRWRQTQAALDQCTVCSRPSLSVLSSSLFLDAGICWHAIRLLPGRLQTSSGSKAMGAVMIIGGIPSILAPQPLIMQESYW